MNKVFFGVGHGISTDGSWDPGTTYDINKNGKISADETEAGLMLPITQYGEKKLKADGYTVYTDAESGNNINMIKQVEKSNKNKCSIHVAVHCDYSGATSGLVVLYTSAKGKKLAEAICAEVKKTGIIKVKGATKRTDLYELNATNGVAVIVECGSIDDDYQVFRDHAKEYGEAIARGVEVYDKGAAVNSTPTTTSKPTTTSDAWVSSLQAECNKQGFSNQKVDNVAGPATLAGCPLLKQGHSGAITKLLQTRLISLGYSCGIYGADGKFGSGTKAAVMKFQKANGLVADGIVGTKTWRKLLKL